jgi:hypothetical protein
MPYKDETKAREAKRKWAEKSRTHVEPSKVEPEIVEPDVRPEIHPNYRPLYNYIKRPNSGKMPNLERLQRIYGSLKARGLADEVWMGNLTIGEIGETVGELPPKFP